MKKIYVSLGSNIGNRLEYLNQAKDSLKEHFNLVNESNIYESEPVGNVEQDHFLNQVVEIASDKGAGEILAITQGIEYNLGRRRNGNKWAPREIDIDILLYGREYIQSLLVRIPHPQMIHRRFILEPLLELDKSMTIPPKDILIADYLKKVKDQKIEKISLQNTFR